ncbi:MAG TPA: hypothetical protein VFQ53_12125 [Kofleriaceae bacterium]|nr:hypothetical protein [Kofleriaceae bacterium]
MKTIVLVVTMLAAFAGTARADDMNYLVGPVLGLRLGGPPGERGIIGIEGGVGYGPERINLGFTRRLDKTFGYVEIDPWYIAGFSFGAGVDSDGVAHGVIGVWEGLPLRYPSCGEDGWESVITIAGGYRYTGVHELYLTVKAGETYDGAFCLD